MGALMLLAPDNSKKMAAMQNEMDSIKLQLMELKQLNVNQASALKADARASPSKPQGKSEPLDKYWEKLI